MKKTLFISVWLLCTIATSLGFSQKKNFTYQQAYGRERPKVSNQMPGISGWLDDRHYLETRTIDDQQKVFKVDAVTGEESGYQDFSEIDKDLPEGFSAKQRILISDDLNQFLFRSEGNLFYYNATKREFKQITHSESRENNPTFSPDRKKLAFTRNRDLYVIDLESSKETRLTFDASDVIYNGWASWVYYEEILGRGSRYKAYWWSPDSKKIAYLRFDDSTVPEFPIYNADGTHGSLEITHYPKAGDPNPLVKLGVAYLESGETVWIDTNEEEDRYVAWPFWTADSKELVFQYLNRDQNHLIFYAADPETGTTRDIYSEKQKSWVEFFEDVYVFEDGSGFLLRSDKNGWRNLYHYDFNGNLVNQITDFDWRVTGINRVVENSGTIYFNGTGGISTQNHLFSIRLNGKGLKKLTETGGTHHTNVSPGGSYYYDSYSNITTPTKMALYSTKGEKIRELGDSRGPETDDYKFGKVELFTITTEDGWELPALWTLPPDFDKNKKYPVIFSIYGGPNAPSVRNAYNGSLSRHYMAQQGVIYFSVDHRCTGHHGKKGVELMHRNLGKWEMHDYIEAVKWLRKQPFVDAERMGITGGSYGGYMTCMALTYGAGYFTHGIAGSSVTSWRLYDNVYTERYMDTPEQNPEGYKNGSVMTYADQFKGKLLITHGTIDDNVHMQNTIQLIDLLEDLNKDFELMLYPNQRHGIGGKKRSHLTKLQVRFWFKHFLDKELNTEE